MDRKTGFAVARSMPPTPSGEIIAQRYRVVRELGRGGMAVALEVVELSTDRHLALKRMLPIDEAIRPEMTRLFEMEFFSLVQLAHPRVIQVFDFAHEPNGQPYYTMELLDGGDLRELAPLPIARVCALLADIGSALSLLHSRRLIHRDVTPRNIRCTLDGKAKLIDFGAVRSFGTAKRLIGTPPFLAPEALEGHELDGRSDLFALGATAYFALTKRHAFPAKDFSSLSECWRTPPLPPSHYVTDIPPELDRLIMSLLQPDRAMRPATAAEVIERLSAHALIDEVEQAVEGQSYLSSPTLVGRDKSLERARKLIMRGSRGRGGALLVSGANGTGRSRFLAACAMEGQLQGALVLRIDAADAYAGHFSAARELMQQVLDAVPSASALVNADDRKMLQMLVPELEDVMDVDESRVRPRMSSYTPRQRMNSFAEGRSNLHSALQHLLQRISETRPVLWVVDDLDRLDEPSAALCALLMSSLRDHALVLVMSARTDAVLHARGALQIVADRAAQLALSPLSATDTQELLASIVGDIPGLPSLVDHVHRIANGLPGHVMQLMQHLLDTGYLRYDAGAWTVTTEIDEAGLPQSLDEALTAKFRTLSSTALLIATCLSLAPDIAVDLNELCRLADVAEPQEIFSDVNSLVRADILETDGIHYRLRHSSVEQVLLEQLADETRARIHGRLASMFSGRNQLSVLPLYHHTLAGDLDAAIDSLIRDLGESSEQATAADLAVMAAESPHDLRQILEKLIDHCKRTGRPAREIFVLHDWVVALTSLASGEAMAHLFALLDQLQRDCGLDIYAELEGHVPDGERLGKALEGAQKRYDSLSEEQRMRDPLTAIRQLARTIVQALGVLGVHLDHDATMRMPSLAPFVVLSPALDAIHKNVCATAHMFGGRYLKASSMWQEVLKRIEEPDRAQLDDAQHRYMTLAISYAMGSVDAAMCRSQALWWADALENDPLFEVSAERIRMNYYFRLGDVDAGIRHQRQAELLQLKNSPRQMFEGTHLLVEAQAYSSSDDMLRLKRILPAIAAMAEEMPNWKPISLLSRGNYQRLRGNHAAALADFETALNCMAPGHHVTWAPAATGVINALRELGRVEESCRRGELFLKDAQASEIDFVHTIHEALARARSARGEHGEARRLIELAVEGWRAIGASGTLLGSALETAARIALAAGDHKAFLDFAARCGAVYRGGRNPALMARHAALLRDAESRNVRLNEGDVKAAEHTLVHRSKSATISRLSNSQERADRCAQLLANRSRAQGALLYLLGGDESLHLSATHGQCAPPSNLDALVTEYLRTQMSESTDSVIVGTETRTGNGSGLWRTDDNLRLVPMLLSHHDLGGMLVTGVVVISVSDDKDLKVPHRLLTELSQLLAEAGDVTGFRNLVT